MKYTMPVDGIIAELDREDPPELPDANLEIDIPDDLVRELVGDVDLPDGPGPEDADAGADFDADDPGQDV